MSRGRIALAGLWLLAIVTAAFPYSKPWDTVWMLGLFVLGAVSALYTVIAISTWANRGA